MQLFRKRVSEQEETVRCVREQAGGRLRAAAGVMLALTAGAPGGFAQQTTERAASDLPQAPKPVATEPLNLRSAARDFSVPAGRFLGNPIKPYRPTSVSKASFVNSVRLADMVKEGKIYLSLSDALALALENNYDIAISRYNLDIADTDILRAKAGATLLGVDSGVISNTIGGSSSSTSGGGPGGTTGGSNGGASGSSGLVLTTAGAGPTPAQLDPTLTGALQWDRDHAVPTSYGTGGTSTTNTYNFTFDQGIVTGTDLKVAFNNEYYATSSSSYLLSPYVTSDFKVTLTQHLLNGAGVWINKRFVYQALNDRRITDSGFRQQILYTVNQVENIYWSLVSSYEAVQAKQHALEQSTKLLEDNKKQLEIGTMAPLDVVNAQSTVATDQQALISAQSTLNYQQQIIKQAIARNLNDPALVAAAVIPTDRVSLEQIPEETQPVEELVQEAFRQRPELEQAVLQLRNNEITLRGARNALLPTVDVYGYYSGAGLGGSTNPNCSTDYYGSYCSANINNGYGKALQDSFNGTSPDKGLGINISIPLRNRTAQAVQARSLLEYRQKELYLEQLYTKIRMQVVNAQFALTNDRAQVQASQAAQEFAQQSLDAEVKKLHLGASTTSNVLQYQRNLATAENTLIGAKATYATDRAGLYQMLASTLHHYGINLNEAASGDVKTVPVVPGLEAAKDVKK